MPPLIGRPAPSPASRHAVQKGNPKYMSTLRRLLFCTALLIGLILLGAQALGMIAAHRYLNVQLAQQSEGGASALAWALSHAAAGQDQRMALADELFEQGLYALIRITDEGGAIAVEQQQRQTASAPDGDWRNPWLSLQAPAVYPPAP